MPLRKILNLTCLLATILCLAVGCARIGLGMVCTAGLLVLGVWSVAFRRPSTWFPPVALVVTVSLAVIGVWQGATAWLMLAAAALALADWDLALLGRLPAGSSSVRDLTLLEKKHFQNLLLALGLAFLVILIGRLIRFHIPLGMMILLVILAFFGLRRAWSLFSE